eukprot:11165281-Lingulodinium_polyedra.AAC.1
MRTPFFWIYGQSGFTGLGTPNPYLRGRPVNLDFRVWRIRKTGVTPAGDKGGLQQAVARGSCGAQA